MRKLAALLSLAAAVAVSAPVVAQARHADDDPIGHVRHAGADRAGDDRATPRPAAPAKAGATRGADDAPGDDRGGHGLDDGPNHR